MILKLPYHIQNLNMVKHIFHLLMVNILLKEVLIKLHLEKPLQKPLKSFFNKNFEASDIRQSIAAVSIKVMEPVFESQTKTKLGSTEMGDSLPTIRTYINEFVKRKLDNFLHKNPEISDIIFKKNSTGRERKKRLSRYKEIK